MAPPKRKTGGGRTTPSKASVRTGNSQKFANPEENRVGVHSSARYTPPVSAEQKLPKPWVPVLMLVLLIAGMVIVMLKNLVWNNNWLTLAGILCILGGLFTATKWR